jgi:hypothetical protein
MDAGLDRMLAQSASPWGKRRSPEQFHSSKNRGRSSRTQGAASFGANKQSICCSRITNLLEENLMKISGLLILLTTGLFTGPAVADTHYSVKIDAEMARRAHVTAQVVPGDRGLCFTRAAHDTGLTHGWATFVHDLSVKDSNGHPLTVDYDGDGCWRVAPTDEPITAEYTMLLNHDRFPNDPGDDELAYAGDWGQFWTGRALFMEGASAACMTSAPMGQI